MITITANARDATYVSDDLITSGSVGIPAKFVLSQDFDGLSNIAVFVGSGVSMDVALPSSGECVVPHEVVAQPGGYLKIGVYGRNAEGTIVIPTVWAMARMILQGTIPSGVDPSEPTPDWTAQVQQMATDALEIAQNVADLSVDADTLTPGSEATVEKAVAPDGSITLEFGIPRGEQGERGEQGVPGERGETGEPGPQGAPGTPGQDGVSPTATVTQTATGATITITDADGTTTAQINNGRDGAPGVPGTPGEDGFSPVASVSKSGKVATISITDRQGTTTATVSDGEDGTPGVGVPAGGAAGQVLKKTSGTDYDTEWGNEPISATSAEIKSGTNVSNFITPSLQDAAAFFGLAKAANDSTQSASSNPVGQYTEAAKVAIQKMLGIYEAPWELIREDTFTNTELEEYNITVDGNGEAFELTDFRMIINTPNQESTAQISEYGRIRAWFSSTNADYLYIGSYTQAAGANGRTSLVSITQNNGMIERTMVTNNIDNALDAPIRCDNIFSKTAAQARWQLNAKTYNKITISMALGTVRYILYGKRKWN